MKDRTITVKGSGKLSMKPDLIIFSMILEVKAESYEDTMSLATEKVDALTKSLISVGFTEDDVKTTSFNVNSDYENYNDENGHWVRKFVGYKCDHRLSLEFDLDMAKLNNVMSAVSSSGANPEFDIKFSIKDKTFVTEQLLKDAVQNAASKAKVIAMAADVSLGEIISINYNWGEIELVSNTRYSEELRFAKVSAPSITPSDITVDDSVTVVWAIS